jgi:hypothetical protein
VGSHTSSPLRNSSLEINQLSQTWIRTTCANLAARVVTLTGISAWSPESCNVGGYTIPVDADRLDIGGVSWWAVADVDFVCAVVAVSISAGGIDDVYVEVGDAAGAVVVAVGQTFTEAVLCPPDQAYCIVPTGLLGAGATRLVQLPNAGAPT